MDGSQKPHLAEDSSLPYASQGILNEGGQFAVASLSEQDPRDVFSVGANTVATEVFSVVKDEAVGHEPSKLRKAMHAASAAVHTVTSPTNIKRAAHEAREWGWRGAVVLTEANPLTNEVPRYSALYASQAISHNLFLGGLVLGGGTGIIEGAGALAAAGLVTLPNSKKAIDWFSNKVKKIVPPDAELSPVATVGIASTLGTPILMGVQQRQNPNRNREEARKQGLRTAAWLTGVFAVEGALISKGIGSVSGLPEEVGLGALSTAALWAMPHWVIKDLEKRSSEQLSKENGRVVGTTAGGVLSKRLAKRSAGVYEAVRNKEDEAVKVGLYGEDLRSVLDNSDSVLLQYAVGEKDKAAYSMPLLVPAKDLKWYNMPLLKELYGEDTPFYYYAHPSTPGDEASRSIIAGAIKEKLDAGAVIFTDSYIGENAIDLAELAKVANDENYNMESLGRGEQERMGISFAAQIKFNEKEPSMGGPSLYEAYQECLDSGEEPDASQDGPSVLQIVEGDLDSGDTKRIWEIYEDPFDGLSKDHPMSAGFNRDDLMGILKDPDITKVVNRVDGQITTLFFFATDFDTCPWFNKTYYEKRYPDYFQTGKILVSAGIVTDEKMQGFGYAPQVIGLTARLLAKNGSNVVITFENTEISAGYIPRGVKNVVNRSRVGRVDKSITTPISSSNYKVISKVS
jgi:hypothetical protein